MKCQFCGAEIKEGHNTCEYCGSAVEQNARETRTIIRDSGHSAKSVVSVIGRVIVALAGIWAVLIVVTLVIVLNSDAFKNLGYTEMTNATYGNQSNGNSTHELPKNAIELMGTVLSCDKKGTASIEYNYKIYEDIKILDKDLIKWLNDTDRSIDTVGISFTTDEKGNIIELGLLSPEFFIMEKDGDRYIAVRDEQVIAFTSTDVLETGKYYGGYFSYPNMRLYAGEEENTLALTYMDIICDDKESVTGQEYYTEEEVNTYKILADGTWYYCSKECYDAIQPGDALDEYKFCNTQDMAFIMKNR